MDESDSAPESPVVTDADLVDLNQRAVLRVLDTARRVSAVLLGVATLLALAWLWSTLRQQGVIEGDEQDMFSGAFVGEDLSTISRVDLFVNTLFELGLAGILFGMGVGIRAYCDVATIGTGGSLTGWTVGDPIEPDVVELDEP